MTMNLSSWLPQTLFFGVAWFLISVPIGVVWANARDTPVEGKAGSFGGLTWGSGIAGFIVTALLAMLASAVFAFPLLK